GSHKAVSHVEQMHQSRCFRQSARKLGCVSCHDPHALPAPKEKVSFYRGRCLSCHAPPGTPCALAPGARRRANGATPAASPSPPSPPTATPPPAGTDPRVPRKPGEPSPARPPRELSPGEVPLVHFHRDVADRGDPGVERDLGMALATLASRTAQPYV